MSAANDNGATSRDLALPVIGMRALVPALDGVAGELGAGGFDHAAIVTLRTVAASSGKSSDFTGPGNLRPAPPEINAIAGALAAMIAEMPVRGGIVDRLA